MFGANGPTVVGIIRCPEQDSGSAVDREVGHEPSASASGNKVKYTSLITRRSVIRGPLVEGQTLVRPNRMSPPWDRYSVI